MMRLLPAAAIAALLIAPAFAQAPAKAPSLAARVEALEKDNATLRADIARLQTLLTQTRREMLAAEGISLNSTTGIMAQTSGALPQPRSLAAQQAETQAQINQMSTQTQLNNLQLQQNMAQDRLREQQLFAPPNPFAATP
ncbi:MAG: hypothetical protein JO256_06580 [Alphaproteobacteria bacterium]|nr:hypothetical protein [Alphaproteobacteria bacterium]